MSSKKHILVINCGTSSVRVSLFSFTIISAPLRLWEGHLKGIFSAHPSLETGLEKKQHIQLTSCQSYKEAVQLIIRQLQTDGFPVSSIKAVGHRVVHGGKQFIKSTLLDAAVLKELKDLSELAPLHNPPSLEGIAAMQALLLDNTPEVAVFDTAFHANLPPQAALYPIPLGLAERYQIKRYGFHGVSHAYLWKKYTESSPEKNKKGKAVTLHLGSGCSLAAIEDGHSKDTTMGFTPLEGLMMSTRSGSIDPAIVAFLSEKEKKSPSEIVELLNHQSGLLGVSGKSGDMQSLIASVEKDEHARLAVDMFVYHLIKAASAFIGVLGGVDVLLFSGGIGENCPVIRERLLNALSWINIFVDVEQNKQCFNLDHGQIMQISGKASPIKAFVVATDENQFIAEEVLKLIS